MLEKFHIYAPLTNIDEVILNIKAQYIHENTKKYWRKIHDTQKTQGPLNLTDAMNE